MDLPCIETDEHVQAVIRTALERDVGPGDATTEALVPVDAEVKAQIVSREHCVVSGGGIARAVFEALDAGLRFEQVIPDGRCAEPGETVIRIEGRARTVLTGERTALNFMQRMSGIATMTQAFVSEVAPFGTTILDTRKTTPGLRDIEKYAVLCGGGRNHRMGLYDRVLIKDNHRRLWREGETSRLDLAVARAREAFPGLCVEVEVETIEELTSALCAKPEWVLLDNMGPEMMRTCVSMCGDETQTEASGGITLETARAVAATGVDAISLGCLTHSAPSVDLSLEFEELPD